MKLVETQQDIPDNTSTPRKGRSEDKSLTIENDEQKKEVSFYCCVASAANEQHTILNGKKNTLLIHLRVPCVARDYLIALDFEAMDEFAAYSICA